MLSGSSQQEPPKLEKQKAFNRENGYNIEGLTFAPYISSTELELIVNNIAEEINNTYTYINTPKPVIILGVLNGAFMFLADLVKKLNIPCEIHFIKVASYEGMESTGEIIELIGLNANISNRDILIVEDIIDTGLTIKNLRLNIAAQSPKSLKVCTLLYKQRVENQIDYLIDFIGKIIEDKFVIGYGLDYNKLGRNLDSIYVLSDNENL